MVGYSRGDEVDSPLGNFFFSPITGVASRRQVILVRTAAETALELAEAFTVNRIHVSLTPAPLMAQKPPERSGRRRTTKVHSSPQRRGVRNPEIEALFGGVRTKDLTLSPLWGAPPDVRPNLGPPDSPKPGSPAAVTSPDSSGLGARIDPTTRTPDPSALEPR